RKGDGRVPAAAAVEDERARLGAVGHQGDGGLAGSTEADRPGRRQRAHLDRFADHALVAQRPGMEGGLVAFDPGDVTGREKGRAGVVTELERLLLGGALLHARDRPALLVRMEREAVMATRMGGDLFSVGVVALLRIAGARAAKEHGRVAS